MAVPGNGNSSDDETFNQIAARLSATGSPQFEYTEWGHESVNMEDIDSSKDETLTKLGRTRSKGGMCTRGAAFSKGENLSVDDTDKYGEDESDDEESSDGGPSKTRATPTTSSSFTATTFLRAIRGANTADRTQASILTSAQKTSWAALLGTAAPSATTASPWLSRSSARAPSSLRRLAAWGRSTPTRFAGRASRTGRTRGSFKATRA